MVKLLAGFGFDITIFGKSPIANRASKAAIAAQEERKALKSLPCVISLGMLATANIFKVGKTLITHIC